MKKFALILMVLGAIFWSSFAFGQNVVTESGPFVQISGIDSNFTYTESSMLYGPNGEGAKLDWIVFQPGSGWSTGSLGTWVTVRDGSTSGPIIYYNQVCDLSPVWIRDPVEFQGARIRPYIVFSECSVAHDKSTLLFKLWTGQ